MKTMYPGKANSPATTLSSNINASVTTINVADGSKLPDSPNLATIGQGESAETILYTGKSGNSLTGVTRGFQGVAKEWNSGAPIARFFTAYDYDSLRENVDEINTAFGEHSADEVAQGEVHGLRVIDGKLEFFDGDNWNVAASGGIPVGNVMGLMATPQAGNKIALNFVDPDDRYLDDVLIAEWEGTKVVRKTNSFPTDITDGDLVLDNKESGKYAEVPYIDEGLTSNTKYCYMLFPYTVEGAVTIDGANRVEETAVAKLSQSAPPAPDVTNIDHDRATVTGVSGTEVRLGSGTWYDSPKTFTGLNESTNYQAFARRKETATHYASPASVAKAFATPASADDASGSPGSPNLIAGTMQEGFFGEVAAANLITGDALASAVGISQGTSQFSTAGWLKFAYGSKILFVAKKPIRDSISWDAINTAKCVYGDTGDKTVVIGGLTYKVRLLRGGKPDNNPKVLSSAYDGAFNHNSEWNRLLCQIHEQAIGKTWAYPNNMEANIGILTHTLGTGTNKMYNDTDLHTHYNAGNGSYSWCQEIVSNSANRLIRGVSGVSASDYSTSSTTSTGVGWRPVLELV